MPTIVKIFLSHPKQNVMSLTDLLSGNYCPITGFPIKKPEIPSKRVYNEKRKEYDKKYKAANKEKIKEQRKQRNHANVI